MTLVTNSGDSRGLGFARAAFPNSRSTRGGGGSTLDIHDVVSAERDKLKRFWMANGNRMRATLGTPLFQRLSGGVYRNIDIRHLHNRFGWQSGGGGLCAGALYRTEAFMLLPDEGRCGTKKLGQTIHVEHTVPVATLTKLINSEEPDALGNVITWILSRSIVTAVTDGLGCERHTMVRRGQARSTNAFTAGHADEGRPFRRYAEGGYSTIWDLVRSRPIDSDTFTLADHQRNLSIVLGWAGLRDWSRANSYAPASVVSAC